ncbi:hypothetical protein [Streptomyces sp. NPDC003717]|uniref:hypothetical protein n=1 Tax=Streptomyces sp. NPDC003717 TaxID=3154276 RepID=UPI0033AC94B1
MATGDAVRILSRATKGHPIEVVFRSGDWSGGVIVTGETATSRKILSDFLASSPAAHGTRPLVAFGASRKTLDTPLHDYAGRRANRPVPAPASESPTPAGVQPADACRPNTDCTEWINRSSAQPDVPGTGRLGQFRRQGVVERTHHVNKYVNTTPDYSWSTNLPGAYKDTPGPPTLRACWTSPSAACSRGSSTAARPTPATPPSPAVPPPLATTPGARASATAPAPRRPPIPPLRHQGDRDLPQLDPGKRCGQLLRALRSPAATAWATATFAAQAVVLVVVAWEWNGATAPPPWLVTTGLVLAVACLGFVAAQLRRPRWKAGLALSLAVLLLGVAAVLTTGAVAMHRALDVCLHRQSGTYGGALTRRYDPLDDVIDCHVDGADGRIGTARIPVWELLNS